MLITAKIVKKFSRTLIAEDITTQQEFYILEDFPNLGLGDVVEGRERPGSGVLEVSTVIEYNKRVIFVNFITKQRVDKHEVPTTDSIAPRVGYNFPSE